MSKKTRVKVDAVTIPVPQTRDEVCQAIADIGAAQRERERIQAAMNDALADVRARFESDAKPLAEQIRTRIQGVHAWCEAHRDELTRQGRTKTAKLATGEVSWRMRPPSVTVRGKEAVIDALRRLKLDKFLRIKVDVDKDAILREPATVAAINGLSISQREDFVIKPDATELEEVQ